MSPESSLYSPAAMLLGCLALMVRAVMSMLSFFTALSDELCAPILLSMTASLVSMIDVMSVSDRLV